MSSLMAVCQDGMRGKQIPAMNAPKRGCTPAQSVRAEESSRIARSSTKISQDIAWCLALRANQAEIGRTSANMKTR